MKRIFETSCLFILVISLAVGCSKKTESTDKQSAPTSDSASLTLADSVEVALNETLERLRYGDKSGLYENEFDYLTDDTTFDDYLKFPQIVYAEADTLQHLDVTSAERMGDSAVINVIVHFKGPSGKESEKYDKISVYYYKHRWIKPTVSKYEHELLYQDRIRQADSAAAAEAGD